MSRSQLDDPDVQNRYSYSPLRSTTSIRLLSLHGGDKESLIVCELIEFETDSDKVEAQKSATHTNGGPPEPSLNGSTTLPGRFTRQQTFASTYSNSNGNASHSIPIISLELVPGYEALSWCWGESSDQEEVDILLREKSSTGSMIAYRLKISWTLAQALRALRNPAEDRMLWIDAISINQRDTDERNKQVQMMSLIYGRAEKVCIWLGIATKESDRALKFIRENVIKLWKFDELCERQEASGDWKMFLDLMNRPWFSRRWVVQEIALAKSARIYCGRDWIEWEDFADAVSLFVEVESATHRLSEIMRKEEQFNHVPDFFGYVSALGATVLVDAVSTLYRESGAQESKPGTSEGIREPLLSIEYLVSRMTVFDVTEPRDIIYALLAIAKDTMPRAAGQEKIDAAKPGAKHVMRWGRDIVSKPYPVDYEQPIIDVCREFTMFCISHADASSALNIICRPWAPKITQARRPSAVETGTRRSELLETLPSWIPSSDASSHGFFLQASGGKIGRKYADPLVGLPGSDTRQYSAAGSKAVDRFALRFRNRSESYSMYVKGFRLDSIARKEVASQAGNIPAGWLKAVKWNDTNKFPPSEFWKTLVAERGPHGRNPPAFYARACREAVNNGGKDSGIINTEKVINEGRCSIVAEFLRRVQAVIWRRSLIFTKEHNRLGLVHEDAEEGDLICILYGCTVPVVLRKMSKTQEDVEKEIEEDEKEYEANRVNAAKRIQRRFRIRRKAREDRAKPQLWARRAKQALLSVILMVLVVLAFSHDIAWTVLKIRNMMFAIIALIAIFIIPEAAYWKVYYRLSRHLKLAKTPEGKQINDRNVYYKLLGECYVHGMMNGEAISLQNDLAADPDRQLKQEIFEIR